MSYIFAELLLNSGETIFVTVAFAGLETKLRNLQAKCLISQILNTLL